MPQRWAAVIALWLLATACGSIDPATVVQDRAGYATSIGNSWKEQTAVLAGRPLSLE
jgi:hypothetical protein